MTQDSFTHETSIALYGTFPVRRVGEIDVKITYAVSSFGCAARINYNEHDHPAEGPEIDVIHVEMLNAPKSGRKPVYIDAWNWLYDEVTNWTYEHASELAAVASLELEERREASQEAKADARREERL